MIYQHQYMTVWFHNSIRVLFCKSLYEFPENKTLAKINTMQ